MLKILKRHRRFEQKDFYSAEEYVTNLDGALWEKRPPDFICVCADFR